MDYLNPPGFLGTGASLLADITLIVYVLLILPALVMGFVFARRGKHRPHHKFTMITITVVNWIFILWLMIAAFRFDVTSNIGQQPGNARYLFPVIHAALGGLAQILATYVVYRMIREDTQVAAAKKRGETKLSQYWFTSAKPFMRTVLILWTVTTVIGILNYLVRYDVLNIPSLGGNVPAPVSTPEVLAPAETPEVTGGTQEAGAPAETPEVSGGTAEAASPVETPEVTVGTTEAIAPAVTQGGEPQTPVAAETPEATQGSSGAALVQVGGNDALGAFLVDPAGRTLYVYANDELNWSNCVGDCLNNWEVYAVNADTPLIAGEGLDGELALSERADGTYQLTYDTHPLYYFKLDRNPGDALGNGAGNLWSVVAVE